ncbi:unnamed protein product [Rotaria sp. Silwood2]|nr:unnamed protein product [Rotaria sp. Silwood2]CAF2774496.1 unnamed protein product [Rotaria sp. Silwood2]CAF3161312.1 unnamed protein product [Rotaria sp. Silwood2]CAF3298027.1 unnamed protein product [Rotaria sp. Silwood2]CAF3951355.1 unnamed protein product [Rotaria sp. Silwood2]
MFVSDPKRPNLSAEYRAFDTILQSIVRVEYDPMMDPFERAKEMRTKFPFGAIIPRPSQCQFKNQIFEYEGQTADAYWINNLNQEKNWESNRILLYFHGGGYLLGDFQSYSGFECHLSRLFNMTVIHLEYRRIPEDPLPAAVHDALTLYRSLLRDGISSSRLVIMGDSAGGGLTLLTVQAILAHQLPKPRAVITLSPWTDLASSGESLTRNSLMDVMVRPEDLPWLIQQALGPNHAQIARDDPLHSPLYGSFKDFPPLYITVGTAEVLEDDSRRVANKAQQDGVDVTLEVGEHLMHVYPLFFSYFCEASNALGNIRQWLETKFQ